MKLIRSAALLILPLMLSGCAGFYGVIPVPASGKQAIRGQIIEKEEITFIEPGKTTRAEVVAKLGTNFRDTSDKSAVAYSWIRKGGDTYWVSALWVTSTHGSIEGGDAGKTTNAWSYWRALFVEYDNADLVIRTEFVRLSQRKSLDVQLDKWAATGHAKRGRLPSQNSPKTFSQNPQL